MSDQQSPRDRTYISRDEFEVFEKTNARSFDNVTTAIQTLTVKIDRMGSTDWKTFGMFASIILAIGSLAFTPFLRDLSRLERHQETMQIGTQDRWTAADQRSYEQQALMETRRLEQEIDVATTNLDTVLQREMRLLDAALQREMRTLLDAPLERVKVLEEESVRLRSNIREVEAKHRTDMSPRATRES